MTARIRRSSCETTHAEMLPCCRLACGLLRKGPVVRRGQDDAGVSQSFLGCDRKQTFLLPPGLDEWLPEDHFARFVIAAVEAMDLTGFYADYRADGYGRPAHDPAMMVALLVYAYARGERSSRVIERGCFEDVAMRFIAANRQPDHTTIARFRQRHERALAELFGQVLGLCAQAGLAGVAVLAVDGTKVHANASERQTRDYQQLAEEALNEAAEVDAAEDAQFGDRRDELPGELATAQGRKKWLEAARRRLDAQREIEARPIPQAWSGPGSSDMSGLARLAVLLVDRGRGHGLELGG